MQQNTDILRNTQMVEKKSFLPPGWQRLLLGTVLAALAGNILVRLIPWPESWLISYGEVQTAERMSQSYYLALTLAAAPVMEEAVFRLGIYELLRRKLRPKAAAFLSALAFGFYHANMIQGLYAFLLGFVLAWGYEKCPWGKYRMAVLMHAAANGAALLAFG